MCISMQGSAFAATHVHRMFMHNGQVETNYMQSIQVFSRAMSTQSHGSNTNETAGIVIVIASMHFAEIIGT